MRSPIFCCASNAAAWLAGAELHLGRYADADAHGGRALALGRTSGEGEIFFVLYQILGIVWYVRGKLAEAAELLDGAIEAARLRHNHEALAWSLFNRSVVALAAGENSGVSSGLTVPVARERAQGVREMLLSNAMGVRRT